jgi:hypothetical protein
MSVNRACSGERCELRSTSSSNEAILREIVPRFQEDVVRLGEQQRLLREVLVRDDHRSIASVERLRGNDLLHSVDANTGVTGLRLDRSPHSVPGQDEISAEVAAIRSVLDLESALHEEPVDPVFKFLAAE